MDLVNFPCLTSFHIPPSDPNFSHSDIMPCGEELQRKSLLEASVRRGRLHLWLLNAFFRRVQKPISKPHIGGIYTVTWFCCCSLGREGVGSCVGLLTGRAQSFQVVIFKKLTSPILPPGNLTALGHSFADSVLERNSSGNQSFPLELFRSPLPNEECVIFDPVVGKWDQARCDSFRGAVCQFRKGNRKKETYKMSFIYSLWRVPYKYCCWSIFYPSPQTRWAW